MVPRFRDWAGARHDQITGELAGPVRGPDGGDRLPGPRPRRPLVDHGSRSSPRSPAAAGPAGREEDETGGLASGYLLARTPTAARVPAIVAVWALIFGWVRTVQTGRL